MANLVADPHSPTKGKGSGPGDAAAPTATAGQAPPATVPPATAPLGNSTTRSSASSSGQQHKQRKQRTRPHTQSYQEQSAGPGRRDTPATSSNGGIHSPTKRNGSAEEAHGSASATAPPSESAPMADDGSQSPSKRKVPALDTTVIEEVTAPSVQKISPQSPAKRKVHASDKVPAPPAPAPTDGGPKSPTKRNMPALDTSTTTSATAPPAAETGPQSTTKRERPAVDAPAAKINAGSPTEHSGPRNPSKRKRSANDTTAAVEANVTGAVTDGEPEAKIQRTSSKDDQPAARVQRASRSRNQAAQPAVSDQATASEKIGERKPASKKSMEKKADADPKPTKSKVPQAPSAKGAAAKGAKIVNAVKPRSKMLKAELMQELERRDTEVEGLKEHVRDLLEERTASKTTFKYRDATLSKHDPEHSRLSAIDDELARKIQTLWDSVTFWTLGNFADAKLVTDSQAATDVLREILPGVNESTKTSTSILLRAIVARYMRTIIESPVLPDAHCPEGSISRRSRDLVEQTTRDIEGTIRTLFDVQLSEVLDADLKHLLYDAVKLALSFRRQEAIYMLEFPGQMQSDPETMLNFLGSAPAADRGTVLFAVFPAILKVRGEGQGKDRSILNQAWVFW